MNVTRDIVMDLLPLYAAGEASAESRAAIEEWLQHDPGLARLAEALRNEDRRAESQADLAHSDLAQSAGMAALTATRATLRKRSWLLALAILFTTLPLSCVFESGVLRFLMLRDAPVQSAVSLALGITFWVAFANLEKRLRVSKL